MVSPSANAWSGSHVLPSESLKLEKAPALILTGGACVAGVADAAAFAGAAGTFGVLGTAGGVGAAGAVGAVGAFGAAGAVDAADETGVTLADSHPVNANPARPAKRTTKDICLRDFEMCIGSFSIDFTMQETVLSSV